MNATITTTTHQPINGVAGWLLLGALAILIGGMFVFDHTYGPAMRAASDRQRSVEIEQEDRTLCTELGFTPGSAVFTTCTRDLSDYRRQAEQRLARETGF
jgi:hypothetical protein